MKTIKKILLLTLCFLQLQCYGQTAKETKNTKNERASEKTSFKQDVEIFKLEKLLSKTKEQSNKAIYNDCKVFLNSNPNNQELTFIKNKIEIKKVLNFYYETGDIIFNLYKSNLGNIVILIEGQDYYGSNLGIYYIASNSNKIIEIDDTLSYNQDDPDKFGVKELKADILKEGNILKCDFYLGGKLLFNKKYNIKEKTPENINPYGNSWLGHFKTQINKNSDDTNTIHTVSLNIKKDSIVFQIYGYHVSQKYLLKAREENNKLKLEFIKDLTEFDDPQIEKIKDFGVITFDGNKYKLSSPFIDINFGYGVNQICILKKE